MGKHGRPADAAYSEEQINNEVVELVHRVTPQVIRALRKLLHIGTKNSFSSGTDIDKKTGKKRNLTHKEALDFARVRLDAARELLTLRFGTKARDPIAPDESTRERRELMRFRRTPRGRQTQIMDEKVQRGELTREEATEFLRMVRAEDWDANEGEQHQESAEGEGQESSSPTGQET